MSEHATTQCRKFPISTMIWAAVGKNYKSKLVFIDSSISQERYREVLKESGILNELDEKMGKWKYIFQQDGATCHQTPLTIRYIKKRARILPGWPPNSPDISPIENLWVIMENRLNSQDVKPKNKN